MRSAGLCHRSIKLRWQNNLWIRGNHLGSGASSSCCNSLLAYRCQLPERIIFFTITQHQCKVHGRTEVLDGMGVQVHFISHGLPRDCFVCLCLIAMIIMSFSGNKIILTNWRSLSAVKDVRGCWCTMQVWALELWCFGITPFQCRGMWTNWGMEVTSEEWKPIFLLHQCFYSIVHVQYSFILLCLIWNTNPVMCR